MTTEKSQPIFGMNPIFGGAILLAVALFFVGPHIYNYLYEAPKSCSSLSPSTIKMAKEYHRPDEALLIDIVEINTKSADGYKLECEGLGIFSTAQKHQISFRQYEEYGKFWISFELSQ